MTFLVSVIAVLLLSKVFPPTRKEMPITLKSQDTESGSDAVATHQVILDTLTLLYLSEQQTNVSLSLFLSDFGHREVGAHTADLYTRAVLHQVSVPQQIHATVV